MTNRKSLAIIIPMLLATTTNNINAAEIFNKDGKNLELYGSINPNYKFSHGFLSTQITNNEDDTNAIFGLLGQMHITDDFSSYAAIEYRTNFTMPEERASNIIPQSNSVRLGYAGFKYKDWGSVDYGRNYGVFHDVQVLTNHAPYVNKNSFFDNNDHYMIGRNNSLLTYKNHDFFGLVNGMSLTLQYQNASKNRPEQKINNPIWGGSLKYKMNTGLTAVGSFFASPKVNININNNSRNLDNIGAYGLGFKYNINDIYIAAFYGEARNLEPYDTKQNTNDNSNYTYINVHPEPIYINTTQNIEAIAEYNFHSGFRSSLSYLDSKKQNLNIINVQNKKNVILEKQINISTQYEFNKNISTYINYKINLLHDDDIEKNKNNPIDNTIGAGIVYQF